MGVGGWGILREIVKASPRDRSILRNNAHPMQMISRHIYRSNALDQLLICCPIVIPIAYLMLLGLFPSHHALVFLAFVVLLGETHFGLTWPFFLDRRNIRWALRKPLFSLVIPAAITAGFLAVYFLVDTAAAILLSSAFSAYHVTMQSAGIARLYGGRTPASSAAVKIIIGSSAVFLAVGFLRFYNPLFDSAAVLAAFAPGADASSLGAGLFAGLVTAVGLLGHAYKGQTPPNFLLATLTGSLLYSPYLFVSRPEHAVAMGVGMHWCQYLAITLPLYHRRAQDDGLGRATLVDWNIWQLGAAVLAYAMLMGYLRIGTDAAAIADYDFSNSYLIVVPLIFQNLHYYSEMFTWKFSDPHIRETVAKYVFASSAQPAAHPVRA